jgi:GTP-binding protein
MAKVSKTPGKTRALEVFLSALPCVFVDLPGYGYASRSQKERSQWSQLIQQYLESMPSLKGIVIIVDARHEPFESDLQMMQWVESRGLAGLVLLNKWDSLSQSDRVKALRSWEPLVAGRPFALEPISCKTGVGLANVERILTSWGSDAITT